MDIQVTQLNRVDLITIIGRVDSNTARGFGEKLNESIDQGRNNLVVDFSQVDYISSAGLRELVAALKLTKQDGGDLKLVAPSERVLEVLEMAGLTSIFELFDNQVEAVGSF